MKSNIASYTVVIEKQKRVGSSASCYGAYVPALGIATEGDTKKEAKHAITSLIKFHVESLVEEGDVIPIESEKVIVTTSSIELPEGAHVSFS